jgi:hypothetical protein
MFPRGWRTNQPAKPRIGPWQTRGWRFSFLIVFSSVTSKLTAFHEVILAREAAEKDARCLPSSVQAQVL